MLLPAGEEESAEQVLRRRAAQAGHSTGAIEHGAALVELASCCEKYAGDDAVPELPAQQRLEQRRLARAVRADERDVLAALEREARRRRGSCLLAGSDVERRRPSIDGLAAARRVEELEAERAAPKRQQRPARPMPCARSFSRRPICVSFACACLAFDFL